MVVLTGGEPLLRRDLDELAAHGSKMGLSIVVGTNGVLLDEARVTSLKAAGAMGMGISLDSLDPTSHNDFRGCPGSWEKTLDGMEACRKHGLPFQVHFSGTEKNAHEVQSMIDFAKASGAHVLNIFFLVCTGRGESMSDITPARYEEVLNQLIEAQEQAFKEYVILGGGSKSDLWCEIMSDVTGLPVVRSATAEATCLGAGILAAAASGWYQDIYKAAEAMTGTTDTFQPDPERAQTYDRLFREVYRPLFPAVQPLVDRLTELTHESLGLKGS